MAFESRRWFHYEEQPIHSNDKTYALTKMWGARTEEAMTDLLKEFVMNNCSFNYNY
tara:strand:- start:3005 stop:3172 length:168 start_codon:yes stop_codon:yes gene_type:complete